MGIWDSIKYDFIGFLTPEQKAYNNRIYAKRNAQEEYWRTRSQAVLRVWYIRELEKYDFFVDSKKYTNEQWQEKDFFDFKKYRWFSGRELFYETVYKVMYSELLNNLGQEKLDNLKIQQFMKEKNGILKSDKMFDEIFYLFTDGFGIKEIINFISKFQNYKEYKKYRYVKAEGLIINNVSLQEFLAIREDYEIDEDFNIPSMEKMDQWREEFDEHNRKFKEEFLEPLYEAYDEQMKLAKELEKSPLAKQINEQNKLLKKQMGIEEEEPIFSFSDKVKK